MYFLDDIKKKLKIPHDVDVVYPPHEIKADVAIPCFKHDPATLHHALISSHNSLIQSAHIAGRYVNIILNKHIVGSAVLAEILKTNDRYGWRKKNQAKVLIEYSSPNVAKPLHIGHLRNTVIGHALQNIYTAMGNTVITENWLGDWGKQYGLLILAYQKWGDIKKLNHDPILYLISLYTRANAYAVHHKTFDEQARAIFLAIEQGDKKLLTLWKKFRTLSIVAFKKSYRLLGIRFDIWNGESFYIPFMADAIARALKSGVAHADGNAVVVDLEPHGLASYLLVKSDGASLYSARDIATALYRLKKYKPSKMIYVVGSDQEFYLKQIFKTLDCMGYDARDMKHVVNGIVTQEGSKMSTRAGNITTFDTIIETAKKKARARNSRISLRDADSIGIGAIVYNLLSQNNAKTISFNWDHALSLQGNTAPYIQYAYVRTQSIIKKAGRIKKSGMTHDLLYCEGSLIMKLARFPEVIQRSQTSDQPHHLATYLHELVQIFNRFYEEVPILKAEEATRDERLRMVACVGQVLKNGLHLLGINVPKRM